MFQKRRGGQKEGKTKERESLNKILRCVLTVGKCSGGKLYDGSLKRFGCGWRGALSSALIQFYT
jgi:hypothetical protein